MRRPNVRVFFAYFLPIFCLFSAYVTCFGFVVLGWLIEDVMLGKLIEHVDAFKVRRKAGKPEPALQTARRPRPPTPAQRTWLQTGYKHATNWLQTGCRRR